MNPCAALLSNYEVYKILKETREDQKKIRNNIVRSNLRSLNTIAYETLKYFENVSPCRFSSDSTIPDFVDSIREYDLSKSELVQLINLRPTTHVELHAIIEECEERYSETQIASLLDMIIGHLHTNTRPRTSDSVSSYLSATEDVDMTSLDNAPAPLLHNSNLSHEEEVTDDVMASVRQRKRSKTVSGEDVEEDDEDEDDTVLAVPNKSRKHALVISDDEDEGGERLNTLTCEVLPDSKIKSLTEVNQDPKVKVKIKNMSKGFKDKTNRRSNGKQKRKVSISAEIDVHSIC